MAFATLVYGVIDERALFVAFSFRGLATAAGHADDLDRGPNAGSSRDLRVDHVRSTTLRGPRARGASMTASYDGQPCVPSSDRSPGSQPSRALPSTWIVSSRPDVH